jgi:hypothetical protein
MMNSEATLQQVEGIIQQIRLYNRQYAASILLRAASTVLPALLVLLVLGMVSASIVGYVNATANNRFVTAFASAVTLLVSILAARAVWLWADRRYGGWTLIRTVGQVNHDLRELERMIAAVRIGESQKVGQITAMAQSAWESYAGAMRSAGFLATDQ